MVTQIISDSDILTNGVMSDQSIAMMNSSHGYFKIVLAERLNGQQQNQTSILKSMIQQDQKMEMATKKIIPDFETDLLYNHQL